MVRCTSDVGSARATRWTPTSRLAEGDNALHDGISVCGAGGGDYDSMDWNCRRRRWMTPHTTLLAVFGH